MAAYEQKLDSQPDLSFSDFVRQAIDAYCEAELTKRSGGEDGD